MHFLHNSYGTSELPDCGADLVGILRWDHKEPTLFISKGRRHSEHSIFSWDPDCSTLLICSTRLKRQRAPGSQA